MYAIVRSGGRQHKVAVGDVLTVDRIVDAEIGSSVPLAALMLVDGDAVTTDADSLAKVSVTAEVLAERPGRGSELQAPRRARVGSPPREALDAAAAGVDTASHRT